MNLILKTSLLILCTCGVAQATLMEKHSDSTKVLKNIKCSLNDQTSLVEENTLSGIKNKYSVNKNELPKSFKNISIKENTIFLKVPREITLSIASYLYWKDFHNFALTSKPIQAILGSNNPFFMPSNKTMIIQSLQKTAIEDIDLLALEWGRGLKRKVFKSLVEIANENAACVVGFGSRAKTLEHMLASVEVFVKSHRIMVALGSISSKEELEMTKDANMCDLITRINDTNHEGAKFSLIKVAMFSDQTDKIIPKNTMARLGIDVEKKLESYKPFGRWIPYKILLDDQV
ncbi:MAG: hypothetical protein ABFQ95_07530 [Pseudomonadota bacterium]